LVVKYWGNGVQDKTSTKQKRTQKLANLPQWPKVLTSGFRKEGDREEKLKEQFIKVISGGGGKTDKCLARKKKRLEGYLDEKMLGGGGEGSTV